MDIFQGYKDLWEDIFQGYKDLWIYFRDIKIYERIYCYFLITLGVVGGGLATYNAMKNIISDFKVNFFFKSIVQGYEFFFSTDYGHIESSIKTCLNYKHFF